MYVETIRSWADLAKLPHDYSNSPWIFRGVNNSSRPLVPAVGRGFSQYESIASLLGATSPEIEIRREDMLDNEKHAFTEFQKSARPHLQYEPHSTIEWLAVARHHGLPTRLLDWSTSPLIAAYFAVRYPPLTGPPSPTPTQPEGPVGALAGAMQNPNILPGAIFAIRQPTDISPEVECYPFDASTTGEPQLYSPAHISPRVTVQKGVFTVHHDPGTPWLPEDLVKYEIPGDRFAEIRAALNSAGINEATLFPDLDGIARHLGQVHNFDLMF